MHLNKQRMNMNDHINNPHPYIHKIGCSAGFLLGFYGVLRVIPTAVFEHFPPCSHNNRTNRNITLASHQLKVQRHMSTNKQTSNVLC